MALALGHGLTSADVGQLIHAHPTLIEMVKEAAEDIAGLALHRPPARQKREYLFPMERVSLNPCGCFI